jgi:hypothetical protein
MKFEPELDYASIDTSFIYRISQDVREIKLRQKFSEWRIENWRTHQ